jgi:hypothetical protein
MTTYKPSATQARPLHAIAREIRGDWANPYFGAVPYLDAMSTLNSVGDKYGYDTAETIVIYFLSNATAWRGDVARRVKVELKALIR